MTVTGRSLTWAAIAVLVGGCATNPTTIDRHTLYLAPPADYAATAGPAPSVRVDLPRYVEDQHLIRRDRQGALVRLPDHAWAESPDEGFARLLREHLAARGGLDADRLRVHFSRFESGEDAIFHALGDWQLRKDGQICARGHLAFRETLDSIEAGALLGAMNGAVRYTAAHITSC